MTSPTKTEIDFHFPFKPYDIQREFMTQLYHVLEEGKVGIFESPTGTGKSLSLLCGALRWLEDFNAQLVEKVNKETSEETELKDLKNSDWVNSVREKESNQNIKNEIKSLIRTRELRKEKYRKLKENPIKVKPSTIRDHSKQKESKKPADYSDEEDRWSDASDPVSLESSEDSGTEECRLESEHGVKIIYCSRTHSQLSQFIHELGKTRYAECVQVISLGSRQGLCVHPNVSRMKSAQEINERCLELRSKKKTASDAPRVKRIKESNSKSCPYYSQASVSQLRDQALAQPLDIESLCEKGRELETCAYYASRDALKYAQLILMPYQLLIHERTRDAIGLNLKGQIVILDEAHNLPEAVSNVYSCLVTILQLENASAALHRYKDRYQSRLNARNLLTVKQLIFILEAFSSFLQKAGAKKQEVISQTDFCFKTGVDHLNMFKLVTLCRKSKLSRKLMGCVDHSLRSGDEFVSVSSPLIPIESFLESLCNFEEDGRIIIERDKAKSSIKFLLLNAGRKFSEAVSEVRSLMIVGGTLEPIEEFHRLLLGTERSVSIERSRLVHYSCGHVVRSEQILPIVVTSGPSNMELDFSYQARGVDMYIELARAFMEIVNIVPKGIVVFFPSYAFLSTCFKSWRESGFLDQIGRKKAVFEEPRGTGVDEILSAYSRTVELSVGGAIIFGVVGGKLSEGMNFSDDLARAVVMAGLPYPNIESPELKEKMAYIDSQPVNSPTPVANKPSQEYYENLCMKAVNQSIGRSIRHIGDYSCVILLDRRYAREQVLGKLPSWIRRNLQVWKGFTPAMESLSRFYKLNHFT